MATKLRTHELAPGDQVYAADSQRRCEVIRIDEVPNLSPVEGETTRFVVALRRENGSTFTVNAEQNERWQIFLSHDPAGSGRRAKPPLSKAASYANNPRTIDAVDSVLRFLDTHREQAARRLFPGEPDHGKLKYWQEWINRTPVNFWFHLDTANQGKLIAMAIDYYRAPRKHRYDHI